jgi:rRNA-processing protein FCF1
MKSIVVDTSSILFALSNKIDIFDKLKNNSEPYSIFITSGVMKELEMIGTGHRKESANARVAVDIIKKYDIRIVSIGKGVDNSIIAAAKKLSCNACTNDIELKKRLKKVGVNVYSIGRDGKLK